MLIVVCISFSGSTYHAILLWISNHSLHAVTLSVFGQPVSKFLCCTRLRSVEHNDVLSLYTKIVSHHLCYIMQMHYSTKYVIYLNLHKMHP